MADLVSLFVRTSISVWDYLESMADVGFSPREETLTENLLVLLHTYAPGSIRVYKTSIGEEVKAGADLAMAVKVRERLWISLLVQAKKLDRFAPRYQELIKSTAVPQAEKLVLMAANMGALPMYLFYNGSSLGGVGDQLPLRGCTASPLMRDKSGPPWSTRQLVGGVSCAKSPIGCSLADAREVLSILKTPHPDLRHVIEISTPWECLLCPFMDQAGGRPSAIPWHYLGIERSGPIFGPINAPGLSTEPPLWVRSVFRDRITRDFPNVRFFISIDGSQG